MLESSSDTMPNVASTSIMTSDGTTSGYQYDAEGSLTAISGASAAYAYNALNQRQKATVNGVTERYGLDLAGRRSTTWQDGTGALELAQYYGDRGPLAFWSSSDSRIHFEHQDTLGTERVRTVYNGAELFIGSLPFGELDTTNGTDIAPPHFALMDADVSPSSGLAHAMFREYSSTQGRWTSPDPYDGSYDPENPQSLNRYTYVLNNPFTMTDSFGLLPCGPPQLPAIRGGALPQDPITDPCPPGSATNSVTVSAGPPDDYIYLNPSSFTPPSYPTLPSQPLTPYTPPAVNAPNKPAQPKSAARLACEANETAYANRVRSDYLKGAGGRVIKAGGAGLLSGAYGGAQVGFAGGELLEPLGGGVPGALAGGFVGGVAGFGGGLISGTLSEIGNQFLYNNSLFGLGGTYQKQLAANIQKNCGTIP